MARRHQGFFYPSEDFKKPFSSRSMLYGFACITSYDLRLALPSASPLSPKRPSIAH
ncbi:hypothetical protein C414_000100003 [Campylobacter jejuni subsp. jejuni 414]|nr:hypothetical protein C414_000100003 [Campylobacter jejuni subsp. jejuni 414]